MKALTENKLHGVKEQMKALETTHNYYLTREWKNLQAQQSILQELISEERVQRAVHLQVLCNKQIDAFGEADNHNTNELLLLTDNFTVIEGNTFIRLMNAAQGITTDN